MTPSKETMERVREKAKQIVKTLNHCNEETFDHPKHRAGMNWQIDQIKQAFLSEREAADQEIKVLKDLLRRNLERMELINGTDTCITGDRPCPNHTLMDETRDALLEKQAGE